ncbi:VOC family protein [Sporosarcina luteola]|uniref:VOC family protein n=1 Tax=Bacillales TaxID=1385 RepID=UPI002041DB93|nr:MULTISPECIES: VOC family protein [Bacillales]MCM3636286.1 VOC family protein [Sporosarcina luteola]
MTQVCVIGIHVPDLEKAIDFYTGVLGFEVNKEYGPKIVTLVHGDLPIVLEETEVAAFNKTSSGVELTLKTDDIHRSLAILKEHDVELIIAEPADCPPGKYISFRDPFGNVWEYLQFN